MSVRREQVWSRIRELEKEKAKAELTVREGKKLMEILDRIKKAFMEALTAARQGTTLTRVVFSSTADVWVRRIEYELRNIENVKRQIRGIIETNEREMRKIDQELSLIHI